MENIVRSEKNNYPRICVIGHFGGKKEFTDGQTVKTKQIYSFLIKQNFKVSIIDTYFLKKNPLSIFFKIRNAFKNNDVIILIVSLNGYRVLTPYIVRLNKYKNKQIFDFVIGGSRYKIFDDYSVLKRCARKFTKIYVETNRIKNEYRRYGLNNVDVIPNFKMLEKFPNKDDYAKSGEFHTCVFSRIEKAKGISDAIEAIKIANSDQHDNVKYFIDIYGQVKDTYTDEFNRLLKNENVLYRGVMDPNDASRIIHRYDALIFPTYWANEGFPGTIIDALYAAVPIIATDWNDNFEILEEERNGLKVSVKSPNEIADAIKKIAHDKRIFKNISKANSDKADGYKPEEVMASFLHEIKGDNEDRK